MVLSCVVADKGINNGPLPSSMHDNLVVVVAAAADDHDGMIKVLCCCFLSFHGGIMKNKKGHKKQAPI
jgi:hypothetical protein